MREISLHILDIAQNSVKADASVVKITVDENISKDTLKVIIEDNGKGMSEEFLSSVTNPFTTERTTRKVGLGIPLIKMACENTGGSLKIESTLGKGTTLFATFIHSSIDRQPLGDVGGTILTLITSYGEIDFIYTHKFNENVFEIDTREIKKILGPVPFTEPGVYTWLKEYIEEGEKEILKA